jgi:hypothetical protein
MANSGKPMKNLRSLLVAFLVAFAVSAQAQISDNLQHLVATNGSLSLGDKTFSNFSFSQMGLTNFDPAQVIASVSLLGDTYFLSVSGNISFINGGAGPANFLLDYIVTASAGQIDMIDQSFTGSAQPIGSGFLAIDETVRDSLANVVANSHLQNDDISDPAAEANDHLNLSPGEAQLEITTGIGFGLVNGGIDTISQFRQSFHQVIPEGGTTALFVIGLGTVGLLLRKKARA